MPCSSGSGNRPLLLLEQGVGDEVDHLEQVVAVFPSLIATGDVVADLKPSVEAGEHLLTILRRATIVPRRRHAEPPRLDTYIRM